MNRISKIFVLGLAIVALAGFGKIGTTKAAATPGSLIKMNGLSSVYYLGADSKRYVFPNSTVYFSWYKDFSGVVTISQSELESYPLAANITMRPGTRLVKITTNPKVYAVEPGGTLRAIPDEATAVALYGSNWNKRVSDVADAFFTNYKTGNALAANEVPAGSLVKNAGNAAVYYFDGTNYRTIADEAAFNANRFSFDNVMTISNTITAGGTAITANEFANPDSSATGIGTIPGQGTGLTVALSANTPASQDVPQSVATTIMKFNVTAANDGDVNVTGVKFTAIGLGDAQDIDQVSVFNNNNRLNNSARDVDSNKEAQINFSQPFTVAKGTTATFEVRAKISGTAKYGLSINKAADINTTAAVSGSFPVNGNIMSGVAVTVGQLTIAQDGSMSDIKLGDKAAVIGKFKLSETSGVEDVTLNAISFKRDADGTAADDDVENLELYFDGTKIASASAINNRYVTFNLNSPITIAKNTSNKRLVVKADAIDGASKTIGLEVASESDVVATGSHYGYQARVVETTGGTWNGTSWDNLATIKAGEVTLEKVNAANTKLRKDTRDQEVGTLKIKVNGKNAEMSKIVLTIDSVNDEVATNNSFDKIENVEIFNKTNNTTYDLSYVSGSTVDTVPADTYVTKKYQNDSMGLVLTNGVVNELVIRLDTKSTATNQSYTFKLANAVTDLTLKETGNDTTISDVTPNSVSFKQVTLEAASATFSNMALANVDVITGASDIKVTEFNIKAGESSKVYVKELKVSKKAGTLAVDNTTISEFKLWKGNTVVKSMSSSNISGSAITFTDLNEEIPANETVRYYVTASFVKDSAQNNQTVNFEVTTATVEDIDGKTVASTGLALVSARTITIKGTGTLTATIDNNNAATKDDTYQLAGTQDVAVASVKMKATNEDVKITKLNFVAEDSADVAANLTNDEMVQNISEIALYDGTTKVAYTNNIAKTSQVTGLSLVIPQTEKTYTIKVKLNEFGKDKTAVLGKNIKFALAVVEAQGDISGDDVTAPAQTGWSKNMGITATKLSAISMVNSYSGVNVDSALSVASDNNVAIVKLTAPAYGNNTDANGSEIKTVLERVRVQLTGNGYKDGGNIKIQRIGGSGQTYTVIEGAGLDNTAGNGDDEDNYAIFDTATWQTIDREVTSGQDAYFLVKVESLAAFVANTSYTIQVKLDALNGTGAAVYNFTWKESDATATSKVDLRIPGVTTIDGPRVTN